MKFTPSLALAIFQNEKNQIYKNLGKPIMKNKNEKYFLNSLRYASRHAALSSFQSSGRITADISFALSSYLTQIAPVGRNFSYTQTLSEIIKSFLSASRVIIWGYFLFFYPKNPLTK